MTMTSFDWIVIGIIAVIALAGQVWSAKSIEQEREHDEHEQGLPL